MTDILSRGRGVKACVIRIVAWWIRCCFPHIILPHVSWYYPEIFSNEQTVIRVYLFNCATCNGGFLGAIALSNYYSDSVGSVVFHTMDMLWEKSQLILPLYMKPISFQSKASVICSVTTAVFIDFCLKKLNVFPNVLIKKLIFEFKFRKTNPLELKFWSSCCVNYFLRYYLMMHHQPIVKRVNGAHEWAHRPYQLLSAPYHCCLYKHRRKDERQPPQSSWPVTICT